MFFKVLRPATRTNRVKNPTCEGASGVTASNGSYTFDTTYAHSGRRCVKGVPSGGTVTLDFETASLPAEAHTMTVWITQAEPTAFIVGATTVRPLRVETEGDWHRYEAVFPAATCSGQTAVKVRSNQTIYVDDLQMEEGVTRSTAINGGLGEGYEWIGPAHYSASIRHRYFNKRLVLSGGVETVLDDDERVIVGLAHGVGVPPVQATTMTMAGADGQVTLDRTLGPRALRFTLHLVEDDFDKLRSLRAELIDLLAPRHAVRIIWDCGGVRQYVDAAYVSGLEMSEIIVGYEKLALNMQADEAGWTQLAQWSCALSLSDTFTAQHASIRQLGQWANMGTGPGAGVRRLVRTADGTIYACTLSDGTYAYVSVWTGETWTKLCRVSGGSIEVHDCKRSLDGTTMYVVGSFTTIAKPDGSGSTSAANIATITLATGAVAAIGSGLSAIGRRCALSNDGTILYVTGDFTTAGGTSCSRVCKITLSGPTYAALSNGLDGAGRAICVLRDGKVVFGGDFASAGASSQVVANLSGSQISGSIGMGFYALNGWGSKPRQYVVIAHNSGGSAIARSSAWSPPGYWTGDRLTWTSYSGASTYRIYMFASAYGWAYLGSTSSTTYDSTTFPFTANWSGYDRTAPPTMLAANGSVQTPRIALWDPVAGAWSPYGQTGFSGSVYDISLDADGVTPIASGGFGTADGNSVNGVAWYNGSLWRGLGTGGDASTVTIYAAARFRDGSIWAVGTATSFGGDTLAVYIGRWIGSLHSGGWVHTDLVLPACTVYALAEGVNGDVMIGHTANGTATRGATTTANWTGTMTGYPRLVITGPGTVYGFGSYQVAADVYCNYTVAAGETLTFDLGEEVKTVTSSTQNNVAYIVRPGSEFGEVGLLPGSDNTVWLLVTGASGASDARLLGQPKHLSVDR